MRTRFAQLLIAVAVVLIVSCTPVEDEAQTNGGADPVASDPAEVEVGSVNIVYRLLTYSETEANADPREFARAFTLPLGESVTRVGEPFPGVTPFGDRTLVKIRNSVGDEAFALDSYIVPGATLGVVIDEQAVLYTRPNLVSPTDDIIPRGSMVAIHPNSDGGDFINVTTYDHDAGAPYFDRYLKVEDVSTVDTDIQAGLLIFVAGQTEAEVSRRELLENAESLGQSVFADDARRELALLRGEEPEAALPQDLLDLAFEEFAFEGVINTDGTTVYRYPQRRSEYVAVTLDSGALVSVEERTVEAFEVDGETSNWFRISQPAGWVFGAYIDPE